MAGSTRIIRRRIKSVINTRKITKAMELVSAAKMRKAVSLVLASRPYAEAAWRAVRELAKVTDPTLHPLLAKRESASKVLVIAFSSDRGLCGGFNSQLMKTLFAGVKLFPSAEFVTIGRKVRDTLRRLNKPIVATFTGLGNNPKADDIRPIADLARADFISGKYDVVYVATTDYKSALVQRPIFEQLLPIVRIPGMGEVSEALRDIERSDHSAGEQLSIGASEYLFEPSPSAVLDAMLPRLVEVQLYQALLESTASEHSARMMAMRSATDSAKDMIDDLTFTFNQIRQASITREIAEISSGAAAIA